MRTAHLVLCVRGLRPVLCAQFGALAEEAGTSQGAPMARAVVHMRSKALVQAHLLIKPRAGGREMRACL